MIEHPCAAIAPSGKGCAEPGCNYNYGLWLCHEHFWQLELGGKIRCQYPVNPKDWEGYFATDES